MRPAFIIYGVLIIIASSFPACVKEYSFEGGRLPAPVDTVTNITTGSYLCPSCIGADNYTEGRWSFYNNTSFYCGVIDTAIATPGRNGFTFFGPSSCSIDSGFVITIIIDPNSLTRDLFNVKASHTGMYYYDNIGRTHPFITQPGQIPPFSLIIDSYIHQTRIMTGRFHGKVYTPTGDSTTISGKYKLKIP